MGTLNKNVLICTIKIKTNVCNNIYFLENNIKSNF